MLATLPTPSSSPAPSTAPSSPAKRFASSAVAAAAFDAAVTATIENAAKRPRPPVLDRADSFERLLKELSAAHAAAKAAEAAVEAAAPARLAEADSDAEVDVPHDFGLGLAPRAVSEELKNVAEFFLNESDDDFERLARADPRLRTDDYERLAERPSRFACLRGARTYGLQLETVAQATQADTVHQRHRLCDIATMATQFRRAPGEVADPLRCRVMAAVEDAALCALAAWTPHLTGEAAPPLSAAYVASVLRLKAAIGCAFPPCPSS